jgi:hypothetical protein
MQAMLSMRAGPGLRRVLDAFGSIASERAHVQEECEPANAVTDARDSFVRGHRKVLEFYRELLATHSMSQTERASILWRISNIESELKAYSDAAGSSEDNAQSKASSLRGYARADFPCAKAA